MEIPWPCNTEIVSSKYVSLPMRRLKRVISNQLTQAKPLKFTVISVRSETNKFFRKYEMSFG